jgi:hypothetical protein
MPARTRAHELIDALPEDLVATAERYLESLTQPEGDPFLRFLGEAPEDDEPTTPEEDQAAEEAWQEYLREGGLRSDEAKRALLS